MIGFAQQLAELIYTRRQEEGRKEIYEQMSGSVPLGNQQSESDFSNAIDLQTVNLKDMAIPLEEDKDW
jgi:hypothetical protein